jgi:DNA-binding NtrC family response regulator
MQALTMIVFQRDPRLAQSLASTLSHHYHAVHLADSVEELRVDIARYRAEVAVLDVEAASLKDVARLHHEFPGVSIVCTHRVADEEMWTAALTAGASDMCPALDTQGIATSAERSVSFLHSRASA